MIKGNYRKLIGKGRISEVYLDNGYAYKTFPNNYPPSWIEYEVSIQNEIYDNTKLPVIQHEFLYDKKEIKMKYINGIELAERIKNQKYKNGLEDLIKLQKKVYEYKSLNLPNAHDSFERRIINSSLEEKIKEIALKSLRQIEKQNFLCHFDLHFSNLMYDGTEYYIIDWINAKLANPILDIAHTFIILKQYVSRYANKYLKMIAKEMNLKESDILKAVPIMASLRLLDGDINDFNKKLIQMILEQE